MSTKKEFKALLTQDAKSGKLGRRDFMRLRRRRGDDHTPRIGAVDQ